MANERSDRALDAWRSATERFDYYVAGISAALVAYLGKSLGPVRFAVSPSGMELVAVLLFLLAFFAGIKRIGTMNLILQLSAAMLYKGEVAGEIMANVEPGEPFLNQSTGEVWPSHFVPKLIEAAKKGASNAEAEALKATEHAKFWAKWSHWLLFAGLVALVASKVWLGYQTVGHRPGSGAIAVPAILRLTVAFVTTCRV